MSEPHVASVSFEDTSTDPPTRGGFYITANETVRVGRDTDRDNNDVVFAHSTVSRNHFEIYSITVDEEGRHTPLVFVRDRQSSNGTLLNKKCVGKKPDITPGRLLQNGDVISIHTYITFRFIQLGEPNSFPCLTARQREELKLLEDRYAVTNRTLGDGAHAVVYLATDVETGQQLACKVHNLDRRPRSHQILRRIKQEAILLSYLDHPNILSIKAAFESEHSVYIFTELATGGDLFSLLSREGTLPEIEIRWIIRQVLNAVDYIHKKGVAHRDIKPENVLCAIAPNVSYRLVLSDFGDSAVTNRGRLKSEVGTTFYRAPECHNSERGHSLSADMWSIGMLCLQLFSGFQEVPNRRHLDFTSQRRINRYLNIIFGGCNLDAVVEDEDTDCDDDDGDLRDPQSSRLRPDEDISTDAQDFIRQCLIYNSKYRLTAREALSHPWICEPQEVDQLFRGLEHDNAASWEPRKIRFAPFIEKLGAVPDAHETERNQESGTMAEFFDEETEEDIDAEISPHFRRKPTPQPTSHPSSSTHQEHRKGDTIHPLSSNDPSSPPLTIRTRQMSQRPQCQPGLWMNYDPSPGSEEDEDSEDGIVPAHRPPLPSFIITPPSPELPELTSSPLTLSSPGSTILGELDSNEHGKERSMNDASRAEAPTTASTLAYVREAAKRRDEFKLSECKRRRTCPV
ncbi:kinase-like domain-containing protein [Sordaria brevicollis]|uniref:Kinase-like domain-containing protein n=1 Tax=Sordaria brevicollis TaxID=83679 RepID=A0AAE0PKC8_SORBR|nr:kinase-like domain-containing protein [Sordaria brevicollis]